jgi:hypothetical protein
MLIIASDMRFVTPIDVLAFLMFPWKLKRKALTWYLIYAEVASWLYSKDPGSVAKVATLNGKL